MTTTIMYIIQLFIHKRLGYVQNQKSNVQSLINITVTCYGWNLAIVYRKSV